MTEHVETNLVELNDEQLDQVQGGLTCRKAGGTQQEFAMSGEEGIIAVL